MLVHWIWFSLLPKLSARQKCVLLDRFSDPEELYNAEDLHFLTDLSPEAIQALENKDLRFARQTVKLCGEKRIGILTMADAAYPPMLRNIPDPPPVLYCRGVLPNLEGQPAIAVVGTRKASASGLNIARSISRQIAACGGIVVSGGAFGIDTVALDGAMEAGGQVVAVLGCGVDVVYPKTNRDLFEKIAGNGCLLSEYLPGTEPRPWQFPERNRILSGLADGVLVVEAPEKSGALITARYAFEQGRDVYAVPGNIEVESFAGSNGLLQEYATVALSGWDTVKEYASQYPDTVSKREPVIRAESREQTSPLIPVSEQANAAADKKDIDNTRSNAYIDVSKILSGLDPEARRIFETLGDTPQAVDEVIAKTELPSAKVLGILTKLALKGLVTNHPGRLVSVKKY